MFATVLWMPKSVFTAAYAALIKRLVHTRRQSGLTQLQLAERLGKPQSFISKIEQGQRRVDVIEFCAIIEALGGDPLRVMSEVVSAFPRPLKI